MDTFFSIIVVIGICYGAYRGFTWMLHAGQVQARKDPPLSPADLKVLEESAARLMMDLKVVTDECVERIESACANARRYMRSPDSIVSEAPLAPTRMDDPISSSIAGLEGLTNGEIDLLRSLQAVRTAK